MKVIKRSLEQKMLRTKKKYDIDKFKEMRNLYTLKCEEDQTQYLQNKIINCNGDSGKINNLIKKWTYGNKNIPYKNIDNKFLANEFKDFFSNKVNNIVNSISAIVKNEKIEQSINYPTLEQTIEPLSDFHELSQDQIKKLIISTKSTTSRLDPIPTSLLKSCLDILIRPITDIVNRSLLSGCFPVKWKTGLVTPLLKKPNLELDLKNYRPVTNLSFISKIIEKAALTFYTPQLNSLASFKDYNSAYKENFSTETLLTKINTDILNNMDSKNLTLLVLLDLSAAFDTVNHDKLIDIFKYRFNIVGNCLTWIHSYMSNRQQIVKLNNCFSDPSTVKHGVPQGSCIGPIFFLAYVSYLYDIIGNETVSIGGFADDHQLYLKFKPNIKSIHLAINNIENTIRKVRNFFLTHNLSINDRKTELIILGNNYHLSKINNIHINVGTSVIQPSNSVRNLGIIFDKNLSMEQQVREVCKKSYFQLYRLKQLDKYLSSDLLSILIHSYISSHLDYCNALYFGLPNILINKLQRIQNSAARLLTNTPRHWHITPILKDLHWLPVEQRILYKIGILAYKSLNGLCPTYLSKFITKYTPSKNLRSKNRNLLSKPKINCKKYGGRGFKFAAAHVWNDLTDDVRQAETYNVFKKKLKTFLFLEYFV